MEIRRMQIGDVPAIANLEAVCFCDPWSERSIASELENPLSCWLVAVEGNVLAGYVGSQTVLDGADMMNLAVAPEFRRNGIGEKLICELIGCLKQKGAYSLALEVRASNAPAIGLYEKLGFVPVGRRPNYYRNPKEDAFIMRKEWEA